MKQLYGVIGNPIGHSMSPDIHNAALQDKNINGQYFAFQVEPHHLKDAVNGIKALGICGVNVTVPHKVAIMEHLDEIHESAKVLGAVNTVKREETGSSGIILTEMGFINP